MAAKDRGSGKEAARNNLRSVGAFPEANLNSFPSLVFGPLNVPVHSGEVRTKIFPGSITSYVVAKPSFATISNRQYTRSVVLRETQEIPYPGINSTLVLGARERR